MTYLGNPKADRRLCQISESSLLAICSRAQVVHSESNMVKSVDFPSALAKQMRWCTSKQDSAPQSKKQCTPNQILVHLKARNSALGSKF